MCFMLFLGMSNLFSQEYHPTEVAIQKLKEKKIEVLQTISDLEGNKNMDYYKAVSSSRIINQMLADFRSGATTAQVAVGNKTSMKLNEAQSIKPMFPDSTGKFGTNWINEEIISVLIIK